LAKYNWVRVDQGAILEPQLPAPVDLTFRCRVRIDINPGALPAADQNLDDGCQRFTLGVYYNPTPGTMPYRGHRQRLFERDFTADMLDRFSDLKLLDYGFRCPCDTLHPIDELTLGLTWFLMEQT
jgi:hypothetical protein